MKPFCQGKIFHVHIHFLTDVYSKMWSNQVTLCDSVWCFFHREVQWWGGEQSQSHTGTESDTEAYTDRLQNDRPVWSVLNGSNFTLRCNIFLFCYVFLLSDWFDLCYTDPPFWKRLCNDVEMVVSLHITKFHSIPDTSYLLSANHK